MTVRLATIADLCLGGCGAHLSIVIVALPLTGLQNGVDLWLPE